MLVPPMSSGRLSSRRDLRPATPTTRRLPRGRAIAGREEAPAAPVPATARRNRAARTAPSPDKPPAPPQTPQRRAPPPPRPPRRRPVNRHGFVPRPTTTYAAPGRAGLHPREPAAEPAAASKNPPLAVEAANGSRRSTPAERTVATVLVARDPPPEDSVDGDFLERPPRTPSSSPAQEPARRARSEGRSRGRATSTGPSRRDVAGHPDPPTQPFKPTSPDQRMRPTAATTTIATDRALLTDVGIHTTNAVPLHPGQHPGQEGSANSPKAIQGRESPVEQQFFRRPPSASAPTALYPRRHVQTKTDSRVEYDAKRPTLRVSTSRSSIGAHRGVADNNEWILRKLWYRQPEACSAPAAS